MNPILGLGLLLAGLLTVQGLLKPHVSPKNQGAVSQAQESKARKAAQEVTRRNMDFGFHLYKKLASTGHSRNIFFSPMSISTAFSMLSLGAQDSTLAEIRRGLNFRNIPDKDLHEGFHYLTQRLNWKNQDLELGLGNTLFIDQRVQPEKKFLADAKNLYNADTIPTNFKNLQNAEKQINDYVSQKTQGKISNLVRNIDPGTVMLLVNYIFFRARWQHEFDPKATKEEDFILDGNKPVKVAMMFRGGMYKVGHDDQLSCSVLEVPYKDNITATFILPDEGKMKQVEEALRMDTFDRWKKIITRRRYDDPRHVHTSDLERVVDLSLPRFSITGTYDLKRVLSHLGITKIFEEQGDLSRLVPDQSMKVGEAVHKAKLKMDEQGSEGAAGSGIQTLPMETPLTFKLNHPFLLMITEDIMATMLFLGKIVNPIGT